MTEIIAQMRGERMSPVMLALAHATGPSDGARRSRPGLLAVSGGKPVLPPNFSLRVKAACSALDEIDMCAQGGISGKLPPLRRGHGHSTIRRCPIELDEILPILSVRGDLRATRPRVQELGFLTMTGGQPDRLVAILHSPPSRSSGVRTLARVTQASRALGCVHFEIANLCGAPLDDVLSVQRLSPDVWATSRREIGRALKLRGTSDVLLAYGVSVPSGPHRAPYLAQLDWLKKALSSESVRVWSFGGRPTHPSRWQRVTTSAHPGAPLTDDVVRSFLRPLYSPDGDVTCPSAPSSAP